MEKHEEIFTGIENALPRTTKTLRAIVSVLMDAPSPISAPDIVDALIARKIRVNKTTVYRSLEKLLDEGYVEEVLLSGEKKFYELAKEHHHHLICLECESIEDWVPDESILGHEVAKIESGGFSVVKHSLELFGICRNCKRAQAM